VQWNGRRVLVTGAGGFIGSHLAERLVEKGAAVRSLVHYNALGARGWLDRSPLVGEMEVVSGDIVDRDSVARALNAVETVFHLASLIAIPYSYEAPDSYMRVNIGGILNVLQVARERGVERIVHTSTSEVYGTARSCPISEEHPLQAQSPYSASKIGADKVAESFYLSYGLPVVTVRPFNTYGPRQSARAVIPTIITQCLTGGVVRLGNLSPTRDLNFVADTVEGFVLAAEAEGAVGRTINLGSGRETSIGDLAALIGTLCGAEPRIETEERRARVAGSEVERLLADATVAREVLGWQSRVGLEQGLERTVAWFREHLADYRPDEYVL
jgi:NAD dependent epimerase/dehydratase